MNGDKMITNGTEHQNRDEESNNTGLHKTETKPSEHKKGSGTQELAKGRHSNNIV